MICLSVLMISSFKRKKKYDLLTCFDDVKFQEEREIKDDLLTCFDDIKFQEEKER